MKAKLFLFTIFAALLSSCYAQTNELPANLEKGRILTTDGKKVLFTKIIAGADTYNFQTSSNSDLQTITTENIIRIEQQTGTEAGKWALWLGLSGLVGSTLGVIEAINENEIRGFDTSKVKPVPIVVGITASSTLIGAIIGSGKKKYKTVYTNPKY